MTRSRTAPLMSSLSLRVLVALIAGLLAGAAAQAWGIPGGTGTVAVVEGLGQLWLNALRMTIIPLVFALLVTGIASIADAAATGRLALKAVVVFALLLVGATVYGVLASEGLHALWPIDPEGGRLLLAGAGDDAAVRANVGGGGLTAFLTSMGMSEKDLKKDRLTIGERDRDVTGWTFDGPGTWSGLVHKQEDPAPTHEVVVNHDKPGYPRVYVVARTVP